MFIKQILILIGVSCLFAKPANAYLDPGSGSYMIQMLIAGVAGSGLMIKAFWTRIKSFVAKKKNEKKRE